MPYPQQLDTVFMRHWRNQNTTSRLRLDRWMGDDFGGVRIARLLDSRLNPHRCTCTRFNWSASSLPRFVESLISRIQLSVCFCPSLLRRPLRASAPHRTIGSFIIFQVLQRLQLLFHGVRQLLEFEIWSSEQEPLRIVNPELCNCIKLHLELNAFRNYLNIL